MKYFSIFSTLFIFSFPAVAVKVEIFSTGQGNTVLLRHNNQAIMIDAGSSESKFRALYHAKSDHTIKEYFLTAQAEEDSLENSSLRLRGSTFCDDSSQSGSSMTGGSDPGLRKVHHRKIQKQYMEEIVEDIRNALPQENKVFFLKTLIITHSDEDHYNRLPA